jgi:CheY-like chemotaxis protein
VRARVFEPFFTTKEVGKGSGLGLSQVYGFVRQSEGEVTLESAPGQGAAFRLVLPASVEPVERPRREARVGRPVGGTEKILLVEDDSTVLALTHDLLTGLGYRVVTATNAADAMKEIEADVAIDLLFTDVVMPGGISGVGLAKAAREMRPGLRVLLTSGFVGHGRDVKGREFPLLNKPYEAAVLAAMLRKLLDGPLRRQRKRPARAAAE